VFIACTQLLLWALRTHYFPDFAPMMSNLTGVGLGPSLGLGVFSATVYLALEPYVRRKMPELLIGWTRALEGRTRDPRIGRELLIGAAGGASISLLAHASASLSAWIPVTGETTVPPDVNALYGGIRAMSIAIDAVGGGVYNGVLLVGFLFLLRLLLRNAPAAVIGTTLALLVSNLSGENVLVELPAATLGAIVITLCLLRGGMLAVIAVFAFNFAITWLPMPLGNGAPYTASSVFVLAAFAVATIYAFRTSLGSRLQLGRFAEELG